MHTDDRWLKSILIQADLPAVALPWDRKHRNRAGMARRLGLMEERAVASV